MARLEARRPHEQRTKNKSRDNQVLHIRQDPFGRLCLFLFLSFTMDSPDLPQIKPLPGREGQAPAVPPTRERQIDDEPVAKRARLTRKNLALFDKMGGKGKTSHPTGDSSTKNTSTTMSSFAAQAAKNGILPPVRCKPPANLDEIRKRHARSRGTVSPSRSEHKRYAKKVLRAGAEATIGFWVSKRMLKEHDDDDYVQELNRAFTNVPLDAGYNNGLSAPQPDFVEGLLMTEFRPFPVDDEVPEAPLYEDDPISLTLPHLAGEWKGPGKNLAQARLQAAYDGAAMVYARNQALAYMGKPDPPGHAAVTTFTTDGTLLRMYAHYAIPSDEDTDKLEYHQYQYASTDVQGSYQEHKDGRKGLRNAQDYAKEQSYALRDQLKEHWKRQRSACHPIAEEDAGPLPVPDDAFGEASAGEKAPPAAFTGSREASRSHASSGRSHMASGGNRKRKASSPPPTNPRPRALPRPRAPPTPRKPPKPRAPPPRANPRPRRSNAKPYWVLDEESGEYCHKHPDGTISWFEGDDNNRG